MSDPSARVKEGKFAGGLRSGAREQLTRILTQGMASRAALMGQGISGEYGLAGHRIGAEATKETTLASKEMTYQLGKERLAEQESFHQAHLAELEAARKQHAEDSAEARELNQRYREDKEFFGALDKVTEDMGKSTGEYNSDKVLLTFGDQGRFSERREVKEALARRKRWVDMTLAGPKAKAAGFTREQIEKLYNDNLGKLPAF